MRLPAVDTRTEGEREEKRREREVQGRVARVVSRPIFVCRDRSNLLGLCLPQVSGPALHKIVSVQPRDSAEMKET